MDPNHDRAVQAAFDGYVPASELTAAKADIEHLSALWIAETRENEKLRAALSTANFWLSCDRVQDYWKGNAAFQARYKKINGALEQKAGEK